MVSAASNTGLDNSFRKALHNIQAGEDQFYRPADWTNYQKYTDAYTQAAQGYLSDMQSGKISAAAAQQRQGLGQLQQGMAAQAVAKGGNALGERSAMYAGSQAGAKGIADAAQLRAQETQNAYQLANQANQVAAGGAFNQEQLNAQLKQNAIDSAQNAWNSETGAEQQSVQNALKGVGTTVGAIAAGAAMSDPAVKEEVKKPEPSMGDKVGSFAGKMGEMLGKDVSVPMQTNYHTQYVPIQYTSDPSFKEEAKAPTDPYGTNLINLEKGRFDAVHGGTVAPDAPRIVPDYEKTPAWQYANTIKNGPFSEEDRYQAGRVLEELAASDSVRKQGGYDAASRFYDTAARKLAGIGYRGPAPVKELGLDTPEFQAGKTAEAGGKDAFLTQYLGSVNQRRNERSAPAELAKSEATRRSTAIQSAGGDAILADMKSKYNIPEGGNDRQYEKGIEPKPTLSGTFGKATSDPKAKVELEETKNSLDKANAKLEATGTPPEASGSLDYDLEAGRAANAWNADEKSGSVAYRSSYYRDLAARAERQGNDAVRDIALGNAEAVEGAKGKSQVGLGKFSRAMFELPPEQRMSQPLDMRTDAPPGTIWNPAEGTWDYKPAVRTPAPAPAPVGNDAPQNVQAAPGPAPAGSDLKLAPAGTGTVAPGFVGQGATPVGGAPPASPEPSGAPQNVQAATGPAPAGSDLKLAPAGAGTVAPGSVGRMGGNPELAPYSSIQDELTLRLGQPVNPGATSTSDEILRMLTGISKADRSLYGIPDYTTSDPRAKSETDYADKAADKSLDAAEPHVYRYKEGAPNTGSVPKDRPRLGIMADEIGNSPMGTVVKDPRTGLLMVDIPAQTTANTAMAGRLNERLRRIEDFLGART